MDQYLRKTSDLVYNRQYERAWQRHCGFLDLTLSEFLAIQNRLMEEQVAVAKQSRLWQLMFPEIIEDLDATNFREIIPLTRYDDYYPHLKDRPDDILARPIVDWTRTTGRGGQPKWVPYTREAYTNLGISGLGAGILSAARHRGDVRIRPNDISVTNVAPRPYTSALMLEAASEMFNFQYIPPLDVASELTFHERITKGFKGAMVEGMDLLGAMTVVLVKMGDAFQNGELQRDQEQREIPHPRAVWRYIRARIRARREGRSYVLPRDIWQLKGLQCGGTDTFLYRDKIKEQWGLYPHESYVGTEAGIMASQAWSGIDMTFIPAAAFFEFIPEEAWAAERLQGISPTETVLLDEVEMGKRYDVVVSNFYGGAFLRYRLHDVIQITALRSEELGIEIPQFQFAGRSGDFIDLSSFAGLIDEKQILLGLMRADIKYKDWVMCKEIVESKPHLHLYIELEQNIVIPEHRIRERLHQALKQVNREYSDIETMLGFVPLDVTCLQTGSFDHYVKWQVAQGADLGHLKPARIQPGATAMALLLQMKASGE